MSIDSLTNEAFDGESNTARPPEIPHDKDVAVCVSIRNADDDQFKRVGRAMTNVSKNEWEGR
jgi:hypothetical protein